MTNGSFLIKLTIHIFNVRLYILLYKIGTYAFRLSVSKLFEINSFLFIY